MKDREKDPTCAVAAPNTAQYREGSHAGKQMDRNSTGRKNFISAVVYVHNAEDRIERFLAALIRMLEDNFEHAEIISVNDRSDDGSLAAIKRASGLAMSTSITVINMSHFHGLELSMNAGVDMAIGDFVYEFDDTSTDFDVSVALAVYQRSLEGYDIVSASPDEKEKWSSRVFYRVFDRSSNLPYRMVTESFRLLSRRAINRIGSMNKAILYRKAVYAACGLRTDHLKYKAIDKGPPAPDKKERAYRLKLAVDSLILFTTLGYRFSMAMTAVMMLISASMLAYTVVAYLTLHPVEGWTTTILFLSVCFIGLFGTQTIIVKYLQLLVDIVFKRKHYSYEGIEKLTK